MIRVGVNILLAGFLIPGLGGASYRWYSSCQWIRAL